VEYRIIIETDVKGRKYYYIQKRFALFFWIYLSQITDMSMCSYRILFDTIEEAEDCIKREAEKEYEKSQKKIVKREVYKSL
jgi:hypothetical protein